MWKKLDDDTPSWKCAKNRNYFHRFSNLHDFWPQKWVEQRYRISSNSDPYSKCIVFYLNNKKRRKKTTGSGCTLWTENAANIFQYCLTIKLDAYSHKHSCKQSRDWGLGIVPVRWAWYTSRVRRFKKVCKAHGEGRLVLHTIHWRSPFDLPLFN